MPSSTIYPPWRPGRASWARSPRGFRPPPKACSGRHPGYLALGLLITLGAEPLVENRAFQLAVAAAAGVSFFALLALIMCYLFLTQLIKATQQTPWGSMVAQSVMFLPPVAMFFWHTLLSQLGSFLLIMARFWSRGTCFLDPAGWCACAVCSPWAGKAFFLSGAVLGLLAELRCRFFKYPQWVYEEQGWSLAKCGQRHLERVMQVASLMCFLRGTSSTDASCLLALLNLKAVRKQIAHWALLLYLAEHRSRPWANGGKLLTPEEFERQKRDTTANELEKLRRFVSTQHSVGGGMLSGACFDEETTRRLEAFRLGAPDARRPWLEDCEEESGPGLLARLRGHAVTLVVLGTGVALVRYIFDSSP